MAIKVHKHRVILSLYHSTALQQTQGYSVFVPLDSTTANTGLFRLCTTLQHYSKHTVIPSLYHSTVLCTVVHSLNCILLHCAGCTAMHSISMECNLLYCKDLHYGGLNWRILYSNWLVFTLSHLNKLRKKVIFSTNTIFYRLCVFRVFLQIALPILS